MGISKKTLEYSKTPKRNSIYDITKPQRKHHQPSQPTNNIVKIKFPQINSSLTAKNLAVV